MLVYNIGATQWQGSMNNFKLIQVKPSWFIKLTLNILHKYQSSPLLDPQEFHFSESTLQWALNYLARKKKSRGVKETVKAI